MSNLARKIRRKKEKQLNKDLSKVVKKKMSLFKQLPTGCLGCGAPFDKESRDDHMTWQVQVYHNPELVSLMCPVCAEEKE